MDFAPKCALVGRPLSAASIAICQLAVAPGKLAERLFGLSINSRWLWPVRFVTLPLAQAAAGLTETGSLAAARSQPDRVQEAGAPGRR